MKKTKPVSFHQCMLRNITGGLLQALSTTHQLSEYWAGINPDMQVENSLDEEIYNDINLIIYKIEALAIEDDLIQEHSWSGSCGKNVYFERSL